MNKKVLLCFLAVPTLIVSACRGGGGGGGTTTMTITIDGGGDISPFNTTSSMEKSETNPFPYNTLEVLCGEWTKSHPNVTVKINKTSSGGDRATLLPQLQTKTAPDIIYQNGTVVNTDLGKDFYLDLTSYLDKANPYNNNKPWKQVYNEGELATTQAADGHIYYINLEKNPVCLIYNKDLLKEAGISHPEQIATYRDFIKTLQQLDEYYSMQGMTSSYGTYAGEYTWYQIAMESNLFSDLVPQGDVLRVNKMVDQEEMCRLHHKKIFDPAQGMVDFDPTKSDLSNNRYYQYIKLIADLDVYKEPPSFAARQGFISGNLGFIEATGQLLRTFDGMNLDFDWGTIPFPDITKETAGRDLKGVIRGTAGLATSWWVSNHATSAGQEKIDACVDLLMFLTSPANNNRLIGDLKGGIPLNPTSDYQLSDYLKPLVEVYNSDIKEANEGKRVYWGSFNTWSVLGLNFSNAFIRMMQDVDNHGWDPSTGTTPEAAACSLAKTMKNSVTSLMLEYDYDSSKW